LWYIFNSFRWVIDGNGNVGIGTTGPNGALHVKASGAQADAIDDGIGLLRSAGGDYQIQITSPSGFPHIDFSNGAGEDSDMRIILTGDNALSIEGGNVGIGTTNPQGKLDVNGSIFQRGGLLHADYVFESDYELESIEEHAESMWNNKHLKAIPKAKVDEHGREIVEVGAHRKGIVEELEKAHIYIEQLNQRLKAMEEKLASLEVGTNTDR